MKMEVRATDLNSQDKVGRLCSYYFHLSVPPPRLELGSNASKALMLSFTPWGHKGIFMVSPKPFPLPTFQTIPYPDSEKAWMVANHLRNSNPLRKELPVGVEPTSVPYKGTVLAE